MSTPARNRARYLERIAARQCIYCAAGLQDGDIRTCIECTTMMADARRRYRTSRKGRDTEGKQRRAQYAAKAAASVCVVSGCDEPAMPDRRRCAAHLADHAAWAAMSLDRKESRRAG